MSYLENQLSAFKNSVSSSSAKLANKKTIAATGTATAVSRPAFQAPNVELKRKRQEQNEVYSQPANTGTGNNTMTQVTYAIEYLKTKGMPQTLPDVLSYLSLPYSDNGTKSAIGTILRRHPKVRYERKKDGGEDMFSFRPYLDIRSKDSLLGYLQAQPTAQGLSVRDLRDGWPNAETAVNELEAEGKLLVTRNKKDNHAKMVWADDSSLTSFIDVEFQSIWQKIRLPEPRALADELEAEKLMPADKSRHVKKATKPEAKKARKQRNGGKTTNTHMAGVLRDYSHLKK